MPRKQISQKEQLLKYLMKHKTITPAEAFSKLGIYNFSARLSELKNSGYKFNVKIVTKKNLNGTVRRFGQYTLIEGEEKCLIQ